MSNPWSQLLGSTASTYLKKYLFEILKERYSRNEEFVDRLTAMLITGKDIDSFGRFVADLYELGYLKAVRDHREELEKRGLKATIKAEPTPLDDDTPRIFPNQ